MHGMQSKLKKERRKYQMSACDISLVDLNNTHTPLLQMLLFCFSFTSNAA